MQELGHSASYLYPSPEGIFPVKQREQAQQGQVPVPASAVKTDGEAEDAYGLKQSQLRRPVPSTGLRLGNIQPIKRNENQV